jgi:rubrerythrin
MLAQLPIDLNKVSKENIDKEVLRLGIIAELDAISLYEQLASYATNKVVKEILLDIAKEEKTHIGEFQTLLLKLDSEQARGLIRGKREVEKTIGE